MTPEHTDIPETQTTQDALVQVRHDRDNNDRNNNVDDNLQTLVHEPLTRASLARAHQHLNLRHPSDLLLLFRWLVRGSWAITKHHASQLIDYGSNHDLTLKDGTGDSKVSVPVNYAVGVSVFFPAAALLVWLFSKVSDYEFVVTDGQAALMEGSSTPTLPPEGAQ